MSPSTAGAPIAAAGAVVWRVASATAEPQIAVVHRPRYDDWSLPKGKLDPGESELLCAVREIHEEIGAHVAVQRRLERVRYLAEGADKTVAYWVMRYLGGAFVANDEVDELRWLSVAEADDVLTWETDREVLASYAARPLPDSLVLLVRHAKAGKRGHWHGPDDLRPLDAAGLRQAAALVPVLTAFDPARVLAAEPLRCQQTVEPLADALGVTTETVPAFSDESYVQAPIATQSALLALAKPGHVTVVSSQGTTIPLLVAHLAPSLAAAETRKGDWWALSFADGEFISADHYDAPVR